MANDSNVSKVLRDLASTCRDAEEGFNKAAKGVHNAEFRFILDRYSVERSQFAAEWDDLIRKGGAEPGDTGHGGGPLRAGWVDLEQRIRPKDDIDILQQAAQGDEGGLKHYEYALELGVDATIRSVAQRHMLAISAAVDTLRSYTLQHR